MTLMRTLPCRFIRRGSPRLTVRRGAHAISTLGCAACAIPLAAGGAHAISTLGCAARAIPLAAGWATTPAAATAWLVLFQSCYAFSFGGFHAYVQASMRRIPCSCLSADAKFPVSSR
eukprot:scaffold639_cov18-Tisochrysis_lutea.AAC.1